MHTVFFSRAHHLALKTMPVRAQDVTCFCASPLIILLPSQTKQSPLLKALKIRRVMLVQVGIGRDHTCLRSPRATLRFTRCIAILCVREISHRITASTGEAEFSLTPGKHYIFAAFSQVGIGRDHTLFALTEGQVRFTRSIVPLRHKRDEERCFVNVMQRKPEPEFLLKRPPVPAAAAQQPGQSASAAL